MSEKTPSFDDFSNNFKHEIDTDQQTMEPVKKRRLEKLRINSNDSGVSCSIVNSPNELRIDRPVRAHSSSPLGMASESSNESAFVRNRSSRASLGNDIRGRVQSPSDKRQSLDFYKEALLRDSSINRRLYLSGEWILNGNTQKTSEEHNQTPSNQVSNNTRHKRRLSSECMEMIDMNDDWEKHLDKLANLYGMLYRDEIKISRMQMNNFDAKLKIFFEEHLHKDAEIRMIKSGTGYFDIRSSEDDWIRIPVSAGDFLYLPPGIYHRFTPDRAERVVAVRLFQSNPKWEAFPRSTTGDEQQERKQFLLVNGLQAPKKK